MSIEMYHSHDSTEIYSTNPGFSPKDDLTCLSFLTWVYEVYENCNSHGYNSWLMNYQSNATTPINTCLVDCRANIRHGYLFSTNAVI